MGPGKEVHPTFLGVAAPQHRRTQEALSTEIYFGRLSRPLSNGLVILPLLNTDGKKLHVNALSFRYLVSRDSPSAAVAGTFSVG
jgi:hypothetical protein